MMRPATFVMCILAVILVSMGFLMATPPPQNPITADDFNNVEIPTIDRQRMQWPYDLNQGYDNYAQEVLMNSNALWEYMQKAIDEYKVGFNLIKRYQVNMSNISPYDVDPYRMEVNSETGFAVRQDFINATAHFLKALEYLQVVYWDPRIESDPKVRDLYTGQLLKNIYENLVICCVYTRQFTRALGFLDDYQNHLEYYYRDSGGLKQNERDEYMWILEWRIRSLDIAIESAERFNYVWIGDKSAEALKLEHYRLLTEYARMRYEAVPGNDAQSAYNATMSQNITNRVYQPLNMELLNQLQGPTYVSNVHTTPPGN